jgi:hypothetical protein
MASPDDDEVKAYQARLKRSSVKVSPKFLVIFGIVLGYFAYLGWLFAGKSSPTSSPDATATATASGPPPPPTPRELTQEALQSVADTYAPLDEASLPEAPIALAKGRKVVFVMKSMGFDPETARLLRSPERSPVKIISLPGDFQPGTPPALAVTPSEVGVVVLERETMLKVGTYTGGKEPAMGTKTEMVAILVPEKKRIAEFEHMRNPPSLATRYGTGEKSLLVPHASSTDEGWMGKAATALYEGRAPETTASY